MNSTDTIKEYLLSRKGQFVTVTGKRLMDTYQEVTELVEKISTFQVRVGVEYDRTASVIEKRLRGELPAENQGLKGKDWVDRPYILRSLKTGQLLARFYTVHNNFVPTTSYLLGGRPVEKQVIVSMCKASEWAERQRPDCFDYPLNSIIDVR